MMNPMDYRLLLDTVLENIYEGILIIDQDGYSIKYNHNMELLEQTDKKDVIGTHYRELFSHIPKEESTLYRALEQGRITKDLQQTFVNIYGRHVTTINTTIPVKNEKEEIIGAIEIAKDVTSIQKMSDTILKMQADNKEIPARIIRYSFDNILGKDKKLQHVIDRAKKAAKNSASVLIYGETGTGKELFAQSIHFLSDRKYQPFLAQNCSAIPETLLEGILFGTTKGSFTGAIDREGLFEQAHGGTLLLDEISAMPVQLQGKLLRVLQENYVRRIGGKKDIAIDVRIIATINESAESLIHAGRLRPDLYYRLNIITLDIPPLRMRKDDIEELCRHFIRKYNRRLSKNVPGLTDTALAAMYKYNFPGNVRELENIIYSAVSLSEGDLSIDVDDLELHGNAAIPVPEYNTYAIEEQSLPEYLESIEKQIIAEKLSSSNLSLSKVAKKLGIKRQTLQYKMKKYGLDAPDRD